MAAILTDGVPAGATAGSALPGCRWRALEEKAPQALQGPASVVGGAPSSATAEPASPGRGWRPLEGEVPQALRGWTCS
jgi:hypothetical protein